MSSKAFDETNIDEIVDKYSNMVYKLAFARVRNKNDADDIFQEVHNDLLFNLLFVDANKIFCFGCICCAIFVAGKCQRCRCAIKFNQIRGRRRI